MGAACCNTRPWFSLISDALRCLTIDVTMFEHRAANLKLNWHSYRSAVASRLCQVELQPPQRSDHASFINGRIHGDLVYALLQEKQCTSDAPRRGLSHSSLSRHQIKQLRAGRTGGHNVVIVSSCGVLCQRCCHDSDHEYTESVHRNMLWSGGGVGRWFPLGKGVDIRGGKVVLGRPDNFMESSCDTVVCIMAVYIVLTVRI